MARLSELILTFQEYMAKHGDVPVVFRDNNDLPFDVLSTGMCMAQDENDNNVKVCWLANRFLHEGANKLKDELQNEADILG